MNDESNIYCNATHINIFESHSNHLWNCLNMGEHHNQYCALWISRLKPGSLQISFENSELCPEAKKGCRNTSVKPRLPLKFFRLKDQNLVSPTLMWNGGNGVSNTINAQTTYSLNPELMLLTLCRVHWCVETDLDLVWLALSTIAAGIGCLVMKTSSQPSWRFCRTRLF